MEGSPVPALTLLLFSPLIPACLRLRRLRREGRLDAAQRLYRLLAALCGGAILLSMAAQEALLMLCGQLTWATGLPLHLCSLMGLLALPTLLTRSETLMHVLLLAGAPGAALALMFPAIAATPYPRAMAFFFCLMHAGIVASPLLPLAMGWTPRVQGAGKAFLFLLLAGLIASIANRLTGGNYLFLAGPVAGTPLLLLARWGGGAYRVMLAALAGIVLMAEALILRLLTGRRNGE